MNCRDVVNDIVDLARGAVLEQGVHERTTAHLRACDRCASLLAVQRKVTGALGVMAQSTADRRAPAWIESRLAAQVRSPQTRRHHSDWRRLAALVSVAAAIVTILVLKVERRRPEIAVTNPVTDSQVSRAATVVRPEQAQAPTPPVRRRGSRRRQPAPVVVQSPLERPEIRTGFLPVQQGDNWTPMDGGRLMRVKLPRSALSDFGFPADREERAVDRVQADVLLSDDGLLRAIRFVK